MSNESPASASTLRSGPALPAFHVAPPRKFQVELPAAEYERLERYAAFYNDATSADEDTPAVAAAILAHFITRDRTFKRWEEASAKRA